MIVQALQVKTAIDVHPSVGRDDVTERRTVLQTGSTNPRIVGRVVGIGVHPVENWNEVERQLVRQGELLTVIQRRAKVANAGSHRVFPGRIAVGIQVFVNGGVRLFNLCLGGALEVHVDVFGEIPTQREVSVPHKLLIKGQWEL